MRCTVAMNVAQLSGSLFGFQLPDCSCHMMSAAGIKHATQKTTVSANKAMKPATRFHFKNTESIQRMPS